MEGGGHYDWWEAALEGVRKAKARWALEVADDVVAALDDRWWPEIGAAINTTHGYFGTVVAIDRAREEVAVKLEDGASYAPRIVIINRGVLELVNGR